jgi:hypothetical protein
MHLNFIGDICIYEVLLMSLQDGNEVQMGSELSAYDIIKLNRMYNCSM